MHWKDMLPGLLDERQSNLLRMHEDKLAEIRLRIGMPLRIKCIDGLELSGERVAEQQLRRLVNRLMENSMYACEEELRHGYFTAAGGVRVGVCGKINSGRNGVESLASIGSICIRIPHAVQGCAQELYDAAMQNGPGSILVISPPGLGKTTIIRDLARIASDSGFNVAIADERREIAACVEGVPQLNVGCRSDVMDACRKELAIPMLIRACAPDFVVADEIGGTGDAKVIADAARCGVSVMATAHARDFYSLQNREAFSELLKQGIFDWFVTLGPEVGRIKSMRRCADMRFEDAEDCVALCDTACMHSHRAGAGQQPEKKV